MYDAKTEARPRRARDPYYLQDRLANLENWLRSPLTPAVNASQLRSLGSSCSCFSWPLQPSADNVPAPRPPDEVRRSRTETDPPDPSRKTARATP